MNNNNNNNNNNNIDIIQRQEALKRRWHDSFYTRLLTNNPNNTPTSSSSSTTMFVPKPPHIINQERSLVDGVDRDRELVRNIVPAVTVVLEGRSICQRINLQSHGNYQSLAKALRQMFADTLNVEQCSGNDNNNNNGEGKEEQGVDISNAIPGHLVAYEDLENDLLLAGDLHWKDFVRVAKRIRILPAKSKLRKGRTAKH